MYQATLLINYTINSYLILSLQKGKKKKKNINYLAGYEAHTLTHVRHRDTPDSMSVSIWKIELDSSIRSHQIENNDKVKNTKHEKNHI